MKTVSLLMYIVSFMIAKLTFMPVKIKINLICTLLIRIFDSVLDTHALQNQNKF